MIKNIIIALLAALCLGLAIYTVTRDDRKGLVNEAASRALAERDAATPVPSAPEPEPQPVAVPEPAIVQAPAPNPAAANVANAKDDEELLEDANDIIAMLIEENDETQKELEKQIGQNPFAGLEKMMNDPAMKEARMGMAKGQVDMMYGGFFDRAGFDDETTDALSALLLERHTESMKSGIAMMTATKEEREERALQMADAEEGFEEDLRDVLGEEGLGKFEQWEKEMPHRQMLKQTSTNLRGENALSTKQEEELVQLMVLRNEELPGKGMDQFKPGDMPGKKDTDMLLERQNKLTQLYLQDAKVVLSESQHEAYTASMRQQQKMMEFGMRMGAQMFDSESEEE